MTENHTPINGTENHGSSGIRVEIAPWWRAPLSKLLKRLGKFLGVISSPREFPKSLKGDHMSLEESTMNMNTEHHSQIAHAIGLTLDEKKKRLKQSIAKMMVYWVAHSRHDLQHDLIANNPDGAWAGLALKGAFGDDQEWRKFFRIASRVYNDEVETEVVTASGERVRGKIKVVAEGAKRISKRVHGEDGMTGSPLLPADWLSELDPLCPSDPTLNVMYQAAAAFVDNNNW